MREVTSNLNDEIVWKCGFRLSELNNNIVNQLPGKKYQIVIVKYELDKFMNRWIELKQILKNNRFFVDSNNEVFKIWINFFNEKFYIDNKVYYRARMNETKENFDNIEEQLSPPKEELCNPGRLNSKGIRYLYISEDAKTAISETRPWLGSIIEVAKVKINTQKQLVIKNFMPFNNSEIENIVLSVPDERKEQLRTELKEENVIRYKISELISMPVSGNSKELEYLVTQCISEYVRKIDRNIEGEQYDGIRYASSADKDGINYLIFNPENMRIDKETYGRFKVNYINIEYSKQNE